MNQLAITITKAAESEILQQAPNCVDGRTVKITAQNGQNISIVGTKKGGVEGGAIISLQNRTRTSLAGQDSTTETKYVAKVIYGDDNIRGEQYYVPNAKSELRA
ncbi:MAG: hypothetical protein LBC30_01015 [Puniceicoccales bacterium]|jgi:hypothetical protein|nr:hypothetical protein [Puniceicoccales bacterium]